MFVIRQPNGNLLVPEHAIGADGLIGEAYVEIGPDHPDFARLSAVAVTKEESDARRDSWREGDAALRREFLDYLARFGSSGGWNDTD